MIKNKFGLMHRFVVLCILILIIPGLVASTTLFSVVFPMAQADARDSLISAINQFNENIDYRITGYENILIQLAYDSSFSSSLMQSYPNLSDAVEGLRNINKIIQRYSLYFKFRRVYIYMNNPTLPEDWGGIFHYDRAYAEPWFDAMKDGAFQNCYWHFDFRNPQDALLDLSIELKSFWDYDYFGIMTLEIPCSTFFSDIPNPLLEIQGEMTLLDTTGNILLNFLKGAQENSDPASYDFLDIVYNNNNGYFFTQVDGEQSLVVYNTTKNGWKTIAVVSNRFLWQRLNLIRSFTIVMFAVTVILAIGLLVSFGYRIRKRINQIVYSMSEVELGNFGHQMQVYGNDELSELESAFNSMSKKLEASVNNLAEARTRAEQERFRLLQAQINPHFLYNTLSLIKFMAIDIEAEEICKIIDSIARFFRISLNQGSDILTIGEELEHIKAYLEIQEQRYPNRVTVIFQVDEELLDCEIIKMTLQPIIENALIHAFINTNGYGKIIINLCLRERNILLKITDDGCGASQEKINSILYGPFHANGSKGFGVRNVHERIKSYYGDEYGLTIQSAKDVGTTVSIMIPLLRKGAQ